MTTSPVPALHIPDYIRSIAPYIGGKPIEEVAREFGLDPAKIVKLASNENPLGIPRSAQRAMAAAMAEIARYPDDNGFDLKQVLSKKLGVDPEWIVLGSGSSDILITAAMTFSGSAGRVVYSQYGFVVYGLATQKIGARATVVPATAGLGHDLDAMLVAACGKDGEGAAQLVYIANPSNPTGTFLEPQRIASFLAALPAETVVLLDEAYTEYLEPALRFDSTQWVRRFPNLLISRTFSKAYGLAGLRIGYGIAQPALTDLMNRVRAAFNVNALAQAAAVAALGDQAFLQEIYTLNRAGLLQLTKAFDAAGIEYIPSYGNFILFKAGDDEDAGARVNLALLKRGVIVRPVANYGLPQWLRVSIGTQRENEAFLAALPDAMGRAAETSAIAGTVA
ncbi:MAG: histidinol-phosphate transaminase [Burkholderiaceae bacterium]